jgi:hypothetical protein
MIDNYVHLLGSGFARAICQTLPINRFDWIGCVPRGSAGLALRSPASQLCRLVLGVFLLYQKGSGLPHLSGSITKRGRKKALSVR